MHDIRRLGLQVFAAPNNLTGEVQIEVKAREIDFVTSFGKNLKALLDILGITRMIRKENNSVLKTKTVKGELQSGDVGEIPRGAEPNDCRAVQRNAGDVHRQL